MSEIPAGAMRFNSDSQKLEYWNGSAWFQVHTATPNLAKAGDPTPGARGVFAGAYASGAHMEYINISSTGNGTDFGDLSAAHTRWLSSAASRTRGVFAGGQEVPSPGFTNKIQFVTFASTGNSTNFTDTLSASKLAMAGMSNETRGVFAGGQSPSDDHIAAMDYITIASTGETRADFGDLVEDRRNASGVSSPTRGLIAGGSAPALVNTIEFITIATLGDAQDFGDLLDARTVNNGSFSNATRGIFGGGVTPGSTDIIEYVKMASFGNAVEFGDMDLAGYGASGGNMTRALYFRNREIC